MKLRATNRVVTGALVLLILLVVLGALLNAPPARAEEAFRLQGTSAPLGLATDHARGRYWLLDKQSGRLTLTALGRDGAVQGQMNSRDSLINAQALAFDAGEAYVGDIGGRREQVTIYQVTEPWPGTEILKAIPYVLTYPDGPHDASAILVDSNHRLHVVTKGSNAGIYRAGENPSDTEPNPLTRVASAPEGITDGVVLLDGRLVLRTASRVFTLDPDTYATVGEVEVGVEQTGQAIAQGLGANEVITASGPEGQVTEVTVPGPAPSTSATPRATRAPNVQSQASDPQATRTFEQTGTTLAIVAALVLSALAASIVMVRR